MRPPIADFDTLVSATLPRRPGPVRVAIVGSGGKTSTLFVLARRHAAAGRRVLVTTTTHIMDPDRVSEREGRGFGPLVLVGDAGPGEARRLASGAGCRVVVASRRILGDRVEGDRVEGVSPGLACAFAADFDSILVEADGARGLSLKAPAGHEPAMVPEADIVIGVMGLDALGAPMDARTVHRPERFGPLVGCAPGQAILPRHLARLAASPQGLFKSAPACARRFVLLNKADLVPPALAGEAARMIAESGIAGIELVAVAAVATVAAAGVVG